MKEESAAYIAVQKRLSFELLAKYAKIKTCPVCQKELEIHPCSGFKACFVHGDFEVKGYEIIWRATNW